MPAKDQALAQFAIVVELAVEDYSDVFGFVPEGLVSAGQINDAQPAHPQGESWRAPIANQKSFFIRATVAHRCGHRAHTQLRFGVARGKGDSADAAHATV